MGSMWKPVATVTVPGGFIPLKSNDCGEGRRGVGFPTRPDMGVHGLAAEPAGEVRLGLLGHRTSNPEQRPALWETLNKWLSNK